MDVSKIIAYEQGELDNREILELFAEGIRTGQVWSFQGSYGRQAQNFIDNGWISPAGVVNWEKLEELAIV